jgi:myxalamid-type polyketide synthase MxaE and MxaD
MYAREGLSGQSGAEGVEEITPKQGAELLALLVGSDAVEAVVLNADWAKFQASTLLSELVSEGRAHEANRACEHKGQTLALEMLLASEVERRAMLTEYLRKAVGQVLRCDASHVNQSSVLASLGMDSIMAVELKNSITADLNLSVSLAELFTDSFSRLVEKLDAQLQNDERLAAAVAEIEQLSLDEVFVQLGSEDRKDQERASGSEW